MNSRVFALNRPPVVAWNVEPQLQLPYADMPAAAAISPIVPGASDPYGRCWQNQVDAGTSFPYFGTLYNNSLPPAAYHLQPGCMANLGQFWPPTPPPDGCGRFDGSNLYFGPSVLRHTENVSSNLHSSFQNLGHYSHLLETPKESSQLVFKRETPISPNMSTSNVAVCSPVVKSENLNSYCVDSKLKSQVCVPSSLSKREFHSAQSPGQDPYFCVTTDYRNCSSAHPSTDKANFSPSYSLKNNIHGSSQDNIYKSKSINGTQENTCNASPLKNVYFSHFESENVNIPQCKKFSKVSDGQSHLGFRKNLQEVTKSKHSPHSLDSFLLHTNNLSKKYNFDASASPESRRQKDSICNVKAEKSSPSDCKFQKLESKDSVILKVPECRNSVFNIPTSVAHLKVEPSDKYFLPSCSSTAQSCVAASYAKSGPLVLINREIPPELRTGATYHNRVYSNPCSLSKSWQYNDTAIASPDKYSKPPEAAKPPTRDIPQISSTLLEGLISVAQTAPQDIDVLEMDRKLQHNEFPCTSLKPSKTSELDDDVQIIGTKTSPSPKCGVNHTSVIKTGCSSPSGIKPLISKDVKKEQINVKRLHPASSCQNIKVEDQEIQDLSIKSSVRNDPKVNEKPVLCDNSDSDCEITGLVINERNKVNVKQNSCKQVTVKSERTSENLSDCDAVTRKGVIQEKDTLSNAMHCPVLESKQEIKTDKNSDCIPASNLASCDKNVAFDPSSVCVPDMDENHGLTLLLNTIEKITSFEKRDISVDSGKCHLTEIDHQPVIHTRPEFSKTYGLDLLSTIAGERLIAEFKNVDSESNISYENASNSSDEKEDAKLISDEEQLKCVENSVNSQKTSVLEMQDRLVELQEKYKQKQKELSRLKSKRLSGGYLKRRQKCTKRQSETSTVSDSTPSSTDLNSSIASCPSSDQGFLTSENEMSFEIKSEKVENDDAEAKKSVKKSASEDLKKEFLPKSDVNSTERRITRRSCMKYNTKCISLKSSDEDVTTPEKPKRVKKKNIVNTEEGQNSKDNLNEEISKATNNHFDNKKTKVYSLRCLSQNLDKKCKTSLLLDDSVSVSKTVPSKRKSDNPKKFMPSKQSKLSETIIAKHLRSRILFDTSGSLSDDNDLKQDGVPEELYDAFMKCNLDERKNVGMIKKTCVASQDPLGSPAPSRLKAEHLVEKQRLLAFEDGLFYAGCIKEVQLSDKYGIALDGQRGNKLHSFSQEELLSQAIVESKPLTSDLPEGTRVCAYWSQQYRCLYPGVVGKAPSPSADWSEPRVFVLFDDGDSGQIPIKNIRLIPADILPYEPGQKVDSQMTSSKNANSGLKRCTRRQTSRTRSSSLDMRMKKCDTSNENESKESSCTSVNESSCDDSCFIECPLSPSQTCENHDSIETSDAVVNGINASKPDKKQRKRSKCKTIRRIRPKETETVDSTGKCNAKIKHHKKYKDKHRRHHHHHHHHRHHHHHHHHSKKRKHRRRNVKSTVTRSIANENIFPCSTKSKSFKNQIELELCTSHVEHSSVINLPQIEQMK